MNGEAKTATKPPIPLEEPPKGLIEIREMEDPVRVKIETKFYRQLEEAARRLKTTPDKLIYNAILLIIKSLTNLTE